MFSKDICMLLPSYKGSCLWNQYLISLHNSVLYSFLDNSLYLVSFASFRAVLRPLDSISSKEKTSHKKNMWAVRPSHWICCAISYRLTDSVDTLLKISLRLHGKCSQNTVRIETWIFIGLVMLGHEFSPSHLPHNKVLINLIETLKLHNPWRLETLTL